MGIKEFESKTEASDFVPWHDTSKWIPGKYYPLPHSEEAKFDGTTLWLLGASWGVYHLDPEHEKGSELFGDIINVVNGIDMKSACNIAEYLNEQVRKNETK